MSKRETLQKAKYLTPPEKEALSRFLDRLEREYADRIRRVVLFGSRARGDYDTESDIDLLIVVEGEGIQTGHLIAEEDILSPLLMSAEVYQEHQRLRDPLYVNLRRDGIELWDVAQSEAEKRAVPLLFNEGEMRIMDEATRETVRLYMKLAGEELQTVSVLQVVGHLRAALSRAYYAAFYALTAALYAMNVVRGKHSALKAALSQFLVKPGLVEEEYKDIYHDLFRHRQTSDYEPRFTPEPEETARLLAEAERFVARMENFLRERGALEGDRHAQSRRRGDG